ncbi:hypothetical protein RAA17_07825 [Komagataeibacter rhaeticus]|nr:hypothetical protein [Komagataeibacter rhaeticus]
MDHTAGALGFLQKGPAQPERTPTPCDWPSWARPILPYSALRALHQAGHDIVTVYSQPPPRGPGQEAASLPVQQAAEELGIAVRTLPRCAAMRKNTPISATLTLMPPWWPPTG